jgi:hypothetical protein
MAWRVRGGSLYPAGAHATVGSPTNRGTSAGRPPNPATSRFGCRALGLRAFEPVGELRRAFPAKVVAEAESRPTSEPRTDARGRVGSVIANLPLRVVELHAILPSFGAFSWRINVCSRRIPS